ncbi:LamG-like jellyroll fold domain-containing protein [Allobranchiibius sp. CTAmp26]|uniref:LamG-like jellyroll fold domain-containing protein n=1 Tax=Allobranchiibius sp. CTAmp26 TaxID=2815214 RepID=UPI001AA193C1|nr:LamG-like jellyroll fold domain-containing protein [Allobranchiibius sp. CTAmp26]MBO1756846.1 hypothetical protein [Allobranchiibius sp. CTAmp26]
MPVAVVDRPTEPQVHVTRGSSWRGGWGALVITALSRAALAMLASLLLWSILPVAIGWHTTVVMSNSMAPQLRTGDIVASRPVAPQDLRVGQVLLADDPDHAGRLRMHRFVAVRADGRLTLRGDANRTDDSTPISRSAVHGVASLRSPFIGKPVYLLRTHQAAALVPILAALLALVSAAFVFRPDDEDDDREGGGLGVSDAAATGTPISIGTTRVLTPTGYAARHAATPVRPRRTGRLVLVGLSVCAISAGLAMPAHAASAFSDTTTNAADTWSAANYFSCANAVQAANPYYFYPLGEQSGNAAVDASGNGRNGTYQPSRAGATSGTTTSPCGTDRATTLNGSSGYVSTPTFVAGPNTFSLEVWFKTTTTRGGVLMGFSDTQTGAAKTAGDRVLYITNAGQLVFGVNPGRVAYVNTAGKVNDGTWHLATATLSSAGMRLYLDGQLADSDTTVTSGRSFNGYFRIGDNDLQGFPAAPTSNFINASVYNAALFGSALTAAQVSAHYDAAS